MRSLIVVPRGKPVCQARTSDILQRGTDIV